MRMWMIDPKLMCRLHLLGEHRELHAFIPSWERWHGISGRISGNAMEPMSYKKRHDALVAEIYRRGYKHNSPLEQPDFMYLPEYQRLYKVNVAMNMQLLYERCEHCRERMNNNEVSG